jgi:hypothetical protein
VTGEPTTPGDVAVVLDTSAITAFVHGHLAVGELLAEIGLEKEITLVPLPCLVEAAALVPDGAGSWLDILLNHPTTYLISDENADWRTLAVLRRMTGSYERAVAAWLALETESDVFTRDGSAYAEVADGSLALEFGEDEPS